MIRPEVVIYNQPDCILPKSFFEGRFIPDVHPDSLDWEQWWDEQTRRCLDGYSDGGHSVTGVYYYHLNFKKINMLDAADRPMIGNPYFAYEDQQLFLEMKQARDAGKGFILITGRGFGKSFDVSTLAEHEFIFVPASEVIVSASTDFFAKELWFKIKLGINSVPDELRPNLLSDTKDYMESGMKWVNPDTGKQKIIGYRSKMHRVVYDNDPGRTRGTRPNIHIFEEVGSWSGAAKLIDCYNMTEASWWRGSKFTSFPVLIGTGGQMKQGGSEDAKIMFEDPEAFNLAAFEWDNQQLGKFIPAYRKFGGFYEKSGISDEKGAMKWLTARREKKKRNLKSYQQEIQEFPFEPHEAFMISGVSTFDINLLYNRYAELKRSPELKGRVQKFDLDFVRSGSRIVGVEYRPTKDGPFEMVEEPKVGEDGKPIKWLYVSGCDSYDAVEEEIDESGSKSKGSIFMFKRFWKPSETGRIFVAKLTQRTKNAETFYWNTVKLNMWYAARMLYEHTKIGIAQHYITNRLAHMLYPRPKLDGVTKSTQSTNSYGLTMPIQVKQHIINNYSKYIDHYADQMYFPSQVLDAMEFRFGSPKFDETMAAALALVADDDMYQLTIQENRKKSMNFPKFTRNRSGQLIFD